MECFLQEIIRWRKVRQKEAGFLKKDLHEKEIFRALCRIFGEVPVEFRLCNTYARTSCMITINGKQILLYDVYLTETFNGMNLMYLKGSGQQSMEKYCCRLVADQLFSMGRYDGSLYMICEYVNRKPYSEGESFEKSAEEKAIRYAVIQQWVIIGHELGHWFIRNNMRKEQMISDKKELLQEIFSHGKTADNKEVFRKQIQADDDIAEECFCDGAAAMMVTDALKDHYSIEEICEAVFLTIEHVRILADIESFCGIGLKKKEDFALQASVRLAHIRFVLADLVGTELGPEKAAEFFDSLGTIFRRYNSDMYHPALKVLYDVGKHGIKFLAEHDEVADEKLLLSFLEQLI